MWDVISWLAAGALCGWLASQYVRGPGRGVVLDVFAGIIGAALGGVILAVIVPGAFHWGGYNPVALAVAIIGAVIALTAVRIVARGVRRFA